MMSLNKYQIFMFITALLFFLLLYLDSNHKIISIINSASTKKSLIYQIENNKKILLNSIHNESKSPINKPPDESSIIDYLTHLLLENNISIDEIQLFKKQTISGINALPIKLNIVGEFSGITHLLIQLEKNKNPILVGDFSIKIMGNGAISMEIQLFIFSL